MIYFELMFTMNACLLIKKYTLQTMLTLHAKQPKAICNAI